MPTIETLRAETRTAAIAAPPAAVLAVIGDPRRLPEWAPNFAAAVAPEGDRWRVDTGAGELVVDVQVDAARATVDVLRPGSTVGARLRALASGEGTELLFTIIFPPDAGEEAVAGQMAVVEEELRAV